MTAAPGRAVLDDPAALAAGDPADMLGAVASGGAQVRTAAAAAAEAGVADLGGAPRPRLVVVAGMGGSAAAGDVLVAVAGDDCPLPIRVQRGYTLPGYVGANDLVVAVSCSGRTEETLSAVADAARRGARLVTVGGPDSPLAEAAGKAGALHVPVPDGGRQPRACLWSLATPLLIAAGALGLADVPPAALEEAAELLEGVAERCGPASPTAGNAAKQLAAHLAGGLPLVWGAGGVAGAAAYRFGCQLAENSKTPTVWGDLPEPQHNQVVAFDGPFGRMAGDGAGGGPGLRLTLLRDGAEHPQVARRAAEAAVLAAERGLPATEVRAEGRHPLVRLASLVAVTDYASVYLALMLGIDPTPVDPIVTLKARLAR